MLVYHVQFLGESSNTIHAAKPDSTSGLGFAFENGPVHVMCTGSELGKIVQFTFLDDERLEWHLFNENVPQGCIVSESMRDASRVSCKKCREIQDLPR